MSLFLKVFCGAVCAAAFVCSSANGAELNLDRTLEKLAASMLRECPTRKGEMRTSEARAALVKEFRFYKVHIISSQYLQKIRRSKADYSTHEWQFIVKRFERAQFSSEEGQFLLKKAKAQKMRAEEMYVVQRLMQAYYVKWVDERTELAKSRMRRVGKAFTAYVRSNKSDPQSLIDFVSAAEDRVCIDPLTGKQAEWVFVGSGPAEIRGSNRHRVIVCSPFPSGRLLAYRWVCYKGGVVGDWKTESLNKAVEKMRRENREHARKQKRALAVAHIVKEQVKPKKEAAEELKITIKELW